MRPLRTFTILAITILLSFTSASSTKLWRIVITASEFVPVRTDAFRGDTLRWVNSTTSLQAIKTGSPCHQNGPLDLGDVAAGDSVSYIVDFGGTGEMYTYFSSHNCPGPEGVLTVGPDLPVLPTSWGRVRTLFR
jgi:hypothetical protein